MNQEPTGGIYDVAVIGGGSAGYAAARTVAAGGLKTVVVEGGREVGGLCILRGCMPTNALLWAAEVLHTAQKSGVWGLRPGTIGFDIDAIMQRKDALIREFADYRKQQLEDGRFEFIRARARFLDPHTLALDNGRTLRARHFVIATGSKTSVPPLPGLTETHFITSDEALHLRRLPKSLIVLGGGAIAVEFAQFFARLGVQVRLIQRSSHLLRDFDADAAMSLQTAFEREGIQVATDTRLVRAFRNGDQKAIEFDHAGQRQIWEADEILLALGRTPDTEALRLEAAGVASENGRIVTTDRMQTSQPHIYAAGDCVGRHEIVHVAIQQAEIAGHNILHSASPKHFDSRLLISVVFTEPQVAQVGLTEKAAAAEGIELRSASYPFNDHGKSLIMDAKDGFVKLSVNPKTGEILGGSCVGPSAGELIHEIVVAMHQRMSARTLASVPHYHPTLAEIWTYPAEDLADAGPQG